MVSDPNADCDLELRQLARYKLRIWVPKLIRKFRRFPKSDPYIYFRLASTAFAIFKAGQALKNSEYIRMSQEIINYGSPNPRSPISASLCQGLAGVLLARFYMLGDMGAAMHYAELAYNLPEENDVVYGKAGFLLGLCFLQEHGVPDLEIPMQITVKALLDAGRTGAKPRFVWSFVNKQYLGAAYGYVGIIYALLNAKSIISAEDMERLKLTAEWLAHRRTRKGLPIRFVHENPSPSKQPVLTHWCHGSPGALFMWVECYLTWHSVLFEESIYRAAQDTLVNGWKGIGLSHGVTGNALALYYVYKRTGNNKFRLSAHQFVRAVLREGPRGPSKPGWPVSLFEGDAGPICLAATIVTDDIPFFPFFSTNG